MRKAELNFFLFCLRIFFYSYLTIRFDRGWFNIHARQMGYSGVSGVYLPRSTERSNNFIMNVWWTVCCGCGLSSFFIRFGGLPRLGLLESKSSSSFWLPSISCSAPFNRLRATLTSVAEHRHKKVKKIKTIHSTKKKSVRTNKLSAIHDWYMFGWNKNQLTTSLRHNHKWQIKPLSVKLSQQYFGIENQQYFSLSNREVFRNKLCRIQNVIVGNCYPFVFKLLHLVNISFCLTLKSNYRTIL